MYNAIQDVEPHEDFTLTVTFDDGEQRQLDRRPHLDFGVFRRLRDGAVFRQARVSFDTVEWPGGIDLDPEYVHAHGAAIAPAE